jgi:hypothetical protein
VSDVPVTEARDAAEDLHRWKTDHVLLAGAVS